jgi:hypothetical protein
MTAQTMLLATFATCQSGRHDIAARPLHVPTPSPETLVYIQPLPAVPMRKLRQAGPIESGRKESRRRSRHDGLERRIRF